MHTEPQPAFAWRRWLLAPLLLSAFAALLLAAYLQYHWPGRWLHSPPPLQWHGAEFRVVDGQGRAAGESLLITGVSPRGSAIAMLPAVSLPAAGYTSLRWEVEGLAPSQPVRLLWRPAERQGGFFVNPPLSREGQTFSLPISQDANWRGDIAGLGVMVGGPINAPVTLKHMTAEPFSPLAGIRQEWFGARPWHQTSINFSGANTPTPWPHPLPIVAGALALALLAYWAWTRFKGRAPDPRLAWALVFFAWLALDLRWQRELWQKLDLDRQHFAGKSWEEKRRAADDGPLFALMQQARAKMQAAPSRVFIFGNDEYARGRASYHLYPFNVLNSRDLFPAGQYKPGDYLVVLGKDEVMYDPATRLLTWEPRQQLKAELLLFEGNNALLRIE